MSAKFAEESFTAILPELTPLFAIHRQETGLFRQLGDRLKLSPDLSKYTFAEQSGVLLTVTARISGELVGYYVGIIQPALHYSGSLHAMTDISYVHPDVRHRGIGIKLFLFVEGLLRERNVKIWQAGSKIDSALHESMDRALCFLGMEPTDLIYSKWLGD